MARPRWMKDIGRLVPWLMGCILAATSSHASADLLETVQIGIPSDTKSLGIHPRLDRNSPTGYWIPHSVAEASRALESMLSSSALQAVLAANGMDSDFLSRDDKSFGVGEWMYTNWALGDATSPVGKQLRAMGFTTPGWMARALFEHVYETHKGEQKNVIVRMRRFAFSEEQDVMEPASPPPRECVPEGTWVKSADVWLGQREEWPYGRIIRWVDCADGSRRAYLWEREWFTPDAALTAAIEALKPSR